jgi:hypothetical protein
MAAKKHGFFEKMIYIDRDSWIEGRRLRGFGAAHPQPW